MRDPTVYIFSAPSGAGKTSLTKALTEKLHNVVISVSHTTRQRRPGEIDGEDYHFVSRHDFESMVSAGDFLEHAEVFDHLYGTSRQSVESQLNAGNNVLLEIDWQGARQIREKLSDAVSIFIMPPSLEALEQRLRDRKQDSEEVIDRRMRDANAEMAHADEYDYIVRNTDFDTTLDELAVIIGNDEKPAG